MCVNIYIVPGLHILHPSIFYPAQHQPLLISRSVDVYVNFAPGSTNILRLTPCISID